MLKIVNPNKMVGERFLTGRFVCVKVVDLTTYWRFKFEDLKAPSKRFVSVDIHKMGMWDNYEKKNFYSLNYKNSWTHKVSSDYFGNFQNACETFTMALERVKLYVLNKKLWYSQELKEIFIRGLKYKKCVGERKHKKAKDENKLD